jgi:hypothetical protein
MQEEAQLSIHSEQWVLPSGALFFMKSNKDVYQGLINYPEYPKYYEKSIMLDLHCTVKKS